MGCGSVLPRSSRTLLFISSMAAAFSPFDANQELGSCSASSNDTLIDDAMNWAVQLLAAGSVVAGAVLSTLSSFLSFDDQKIRDERRLLRFLRLFARTLLVTSVTMEILCIYSACVLITTLLHEKSFGTTKDFDGSAITFLQTNFEVEYLVIVVGFLQGLIQWLAGIACYMTIPSEHEVVRKTNQFLAFMIVSVVLSLMSALDGKEPFYGGYLKLLWRGQSVLWRGRIARFDGLNNPLELLRWLVWVCELLFGVRALLSFLKRR